ncbi:MAG: zeta toxin family protein [Thermodesulfobacteriota bacterium]
MAESKQPERMGKKLVIVSGSYGSGKTEFAINLAVKARHEEKGRVLLVDLDVVNPYFRSRDVREEFTAKGIDVVAPEGSFSHADLPMLSPRVGGAITDTDATVILDAGGDPAGARVLARYREDIEKRGYLLWLIANTRRPATRTAQEIGAMMDAISTISGLGFTGIVANSHLMEETSPEIIREGASVASQVALDRGLRFEFVCVSERLMGKEALAGLGAPVLILSRYMKKPWEIGAGVHHRI